MRAVVIRGAGNISVEDVPAPEPEPGAAIVDVLVAGICGTDLQLARGYMGFTGVPGHEFLGTVRHVISPADRPLVGARVAGEINIGCEECHRCAQRMARHCGRRRVLGILGKDGAFAEQLTLPIANLHVVPDEVCDEHAVFIEPLAAAYEILEQISLGPSERVLVLGDGRLGLLAAQVMSAAGADVTLAGHHPGKLDLARDLGIDAVRSPEGIPGEPFPVVVEATGTVEALDQAIGLTAPRGTVVMKSTCAGSTPFDAARAVVNEITLVGSRCGRFGPAIEALRTGEVQVAPLITDRFTLEEGISAFERAAAPDALKVLLRMA